jgi:hypothetical protein
MIKAGGCSDIFCYACINGNAIGCVTMEFGQASIAFSSEILCSILPLPFLVERIKASKDNGNVASLETIYTKGMKILAMEGRQLTKSIHCSIISPSP